MREVRPDVWHWESLHPEWVPEDGWDHKEVSSYAIDDGDRLLLFDPLACRPRSRSSRGSARLQSC